MDRTSIRVLIIDDEPTACSNLERLLKDYTDSLIKVVGMATSTLLEAEHKISVLQPDVLFLDIQMPNENAFQFLERIEHIPFEIIFVTAYDEFAVKAFKLNAVDYILKPINIGELKRAVEKLREKMAFKDYIALQQQELAHLAQQINTRQQQQNMVLRNGHSFEIVPFNCIEYFEAMGSYSRIFYRKEGFAKNVTMARPITEYEEILPDTIFFRSHKSYLVNCLFVKKVIKGEQAYLELNNGHLLPIARRRYTKIMNFLQHHIQF